MRRGAGTEIFALLRTDTIVSFACLRMVGGSRLSSWSTWGNAAYLWGFSCIDFRARLGNTVV